jgi:hypothetical protein
MMELQQATCISSIETFIQGVRGNETAVAFFKELVCFAYKLPRRMCSLLEVLCVCSDHSEAYKSYVCAQSYPSDVLSLSRAS